MIVVDANILLYAYDRRSEFHERARVWIESVFSGNESVALPWQSICSFLRVITNPKLPGSRLSLSDASSIVDAWVSQPNVRLLGPGDGHWTILRSAMIDGQVRGPLITDAQLAAVTMEYGGVLHTTDRDFARFPGLRWRNPLHAG